MIAAIVVHTPLWVWGLLAGLTALGLWQTRTRELSPARVMALPRVMVALSLAGVVSAFGAAPAALLGWAAGIGFVLSVVRPALTIPGARWDPARGVVVVPGSVLPLALILSLFALKYAAGASLALHPALAAHPWFGGAFALGYGLFSGAFLARGLNLRQLADPMPALRPA